MVGAEFVEIECRCQNIVINHTSPLKFVAFSFINPIIMIA